MTPRRWTSLLIAALFLIVAATAVKAGDETCAVIEVEWFSPSGVAGCSLDGPTQGKASTYPGDVAAAQWCLYPWTN